MRSIVRFTVQLAAVLFLLIFLSGCQSFRPWGYQPPTDSYEYIMQRDGDPSKKRQATGDATWIGDAIIGLLQGLAGGR